MSLYDESQLKAWPGGYLTGTFEALLEEGYLAQVRMRRRQLSQMTTALDPESAKRRIPDSQYHVSRKMDGEFTCLIWRDGEICTLNPGGTLRAGAPFLKEAAKRLKGVKTALLGGELYVQRPDGARPRVHDVVRVARKPESAEEVGQLAFAVFDIYELDGTDPSITYADSLSKNQELFSGGSLIHPVETVAGENSKTVLKQFKEWVLEDGAEGVVARSPTAGIYKVKPRHSLDLAIVGFSEGLEDRAGMIHDILVAVVRPSGRYQLLAKVGGGYSDEERLGLFKTLSKRVVESDYREVNSDRVAYQMIEPGLVMEIECLDLISRTSRDNTIEKMILDWTGEAWEGVRRLPLASILSPQFIRIRDDKEANDEEAGISQLYDIVDIPDIDRVAKEVALPNAEIIARAVATKTAKDATMVRKVIAIKTNKEEVSQDFPAYVLHITDFSPNRASKLQTAVKVSVDRDQIMDLFEEAKVDKFQKGLDRSVRIVSWNIQQGGGSRLEGISAALLGWSPDIVVLQEVRRKTGAAIGKTLAGIGLAETYLYETETAAENTLFIASRDPLEAGPFLEGQSGLCHILEAETAGLTILPAHFPQKAAQVPLFDALLADSDSLLPLRSLLIGDLNCGIPFQDSTEKTFVNTKYFQALKDAGWVDLYRQINGEEARDYTWISPRTGRGFRYDHALASPALASHATGFKVDHTVREAKLSDHSALVLEIA